MSIPYHHNKNFATSSNFGWGVTGGTRVGAMQSAGDAVYITGSGDGTQQTFEFADTSLSSEYMCIGVEAEFYYKDGDFTFDVKRRDSQEGKQWMSFPRYSYFQGGASYEYGRVFLANRPDCEILGHDASWGNSINLSDYSFGFTQSGSTAPSIGFFTIKVFYREKTTFNEIAAGTKCAYFQFAEIEGIRYVPSDIGPTVDGRADVGAYYYGWDRLPINSAMATVGSVLSGQRDRATGQITHPGATLEFQDVDRVSFEENHLELYPRGFFSWLLAYGDRENFASARMVNSLTYNDVYGLNPKDFSNSLGTVFEVDDASGFPVGSTANSYVYIDKECVWYDGFVVDQFGTDGADNRSLGRGMFGSLNAAHRRNEKTGVYPLVSEHPTNWKSRWVRVWTVPYDPVTGFPMPIELGVAQTFIWNNHEQRIGSGDVTYSVSCAPFYNILNQSPIRQDNARIKNIYLGNLTEFFSLQEDSKHFRLPLDNATYESALDIITELQGDMSGGLTSQPGGTASSFIWTMTLKGSVYGRAAVTARLRTSTDEDLSLWYSTNAGQALGFKSDEFQKHAPTDTEEVSTDFWIYNWVAQNEVARVYCPYRTDILYLNSDDIQDWGNSVGWVANDASGSAFVGFNVGAGKDGGYYAVPSPDGKFNDATFGDYYRLHYYDNLTYKDDDGKVISSTSSEPPPVCRRVAIFSQVKPSYPLLTLLTSSGYGVNGDYDVFPNGLGLGIRSELIDDDSFVLASEKLEAFGTYRSLIVDSDTKMSSLIESELGLPLDLSLTLDSQGRLVISDSSSGYSTLTDSLHSVLDEHVVKGSSMSVAHGVDSVINKISLDCQYDEKENKYMLKLIAVEPNSVAKYGEKEISVSNKGIRSEHGGLVGSITGEDVHSSFIAACTYFFEQHAFEKPTVNITLTHSAVPLLAGDQVMLTASDLQDVTNSAATGITDKNASVLSIDKSLNDGVCSAKLTYDRLKRKFGGWAPSLELTSYNNSTGVGVVAENQFTTGNGGQRVLSDDSDYFSIGDKVILVERDSKTPATKDTTITAVSSTSVTVGTHTNTVFNSGAYVVFANYDTCDQGQLDDGYCIVSQDDGFIDDGNEIPAYNYSV